MTLNEIKLAVESGRPVYWSHDGYPVIKDGLGRFLICCIQNQSCWGLTWQDGVTMNESEDKFYIKGNKS
jgi:hypothetical protein